jgi:uncharacterized protein (DUF2336 family)
MSKVNGAMIVHKFLAWAETAPTGRRAEGANLLARAYLHSPIDAETRSAMEAVLTLLLDDPAPEVRLALADALGASPRAPRHVIIALANDHDDIARLVLARSPVLIDAELVDIAAAAEEPLQMAVALRPRVSSLVCAALAEVGARHACRAMLANHNAEVTRVSMVRIAERFGDDPAVRDVLMARPDLPADVHQMLVRQLGDALTGLMVRKGWADPERAAKVTRQSCDRVSVVIARHAPDNELALLVEHLRISGQLTTELLLRAICQGRMRFFEAALSNLAKAPPRRVATLVRAGRTAALRAIYTKAGLPKSTFEAFAAALDAWRDLGADDVHNDQYALTMQMLSGVTERFAERTGGEMSDLASMLRLFAADQARDAAREYMRLKPARIEAITSVAA